MDINTLRMLYDYTYWAHDRVWACIDTISDADYRRDLGYSMGSIHGLMVHLMTAEDLWFRRMQGQSPVHLWDPVEFPSQGALRAQWAQVEQRVRDHLAGLTDDDLHIDFTYQTTDGTTYTNRVSDILLHVVNHSTDHRAQVLALIDSVGGETVGQDLITYLRTTR